MTAPTKSSLRFPVRYHQRIRMRGFPAIVLARATAKAGWKVSGIAVRQALTKSISQAQAAGRVIFGTNLKG